MGQARIFLRAGLSPCPPSTPFPLGTYWSNRKRIYIHVYNLLRIGQIGPPPLPLGFSAPLTVVPHLYCV